SRNLPLPLSSPGRGSAVPSMTTSNCALLSSFERPDSLYSYVPSPTSRTSSLYSAGSSASLHGPHVYRSPSWAVTGDGTIAWTRTHALPVLNVRVTSRVATYHSASWPTSRAAPAGRLIFTCSAVGIAVLSDCGGSVGWMHATSEAAKVAVRRVLVNIGGAPVG